MIKLKKDYLVLGAKVVVLLTGLLLIVVSGYVYSTIGELKLKLQESKLSKASINQIESIIEGDTKVQRVHLEDFLVFTDSYKFIEKSIEDKNLEKMRHHYYSLKDMSLPESFENHCNRVRCIQMKREFGKIPSSIWKALLGTEDFRFLDHRGVDPIAIARAIVVDIIAMKFVQGGSTLTQQLMKNLFLTNERSISRKIKEMVYALYIENVMAKEEIITLYLNEVFWGTFQGVYIKGYHAASLAYFNKAPEYLTEFEATLLVSLLKGPNYYRPSKKLPRIKSRTTAVYKRLMGLNLVSQNPGNIWDEIAWEKFQEEFIRRTEKNHFELYHLVSKNADGGLEPFEKYVFYDSIKKRQKALKEITKDADVAVKGIIAEKSCTDYDCGKLFSYYSKIEREKRQSITGEFHQIGSLFKPIVYDSFITLGRDYNEEISTDKIVLNLKSGDWSPKDYSKAKTETIPLKVALQKSKNIPLIRVASEVGFDKLEELLGPKIPRLKLPLGEYPAQLLGAIELSLEEVFLVYKKFIQDKCDQIKSSDLKLEDTILYYMSVASETTISKLARGPLRNAYIFGKTGTTNKGLDNWYFAFDGKQIYVIWFGVESNRDKHDFRISGATTSFLIFQDFINNRGKQVSEIHCE